ncbi:mitogen-activated protein kinase kinase kinase 17, partial [Eutrema salsugineum]|uniref:mitogen-activated protein kinase kinase kinase 17 n=1 Tax=Eutrema salsugineum TaxID=72664 RepID=UPI000CED4854
MKRSMSNSNNSSRFGQWHDDYDSNRPYKKLKTDRVTEDDADSSSKTNTFQKQPIISNNVPDTEWWVVTRFRGKVSYGSVHVAVSTAIGEDNSLPNEMAIKTTEFSQASRLKNEGKFLHRLQDSPYVVSYYGNVDENTKKMLYNTILEYCPGQCLEKSIKSQRGRGLPENDVKRFAVDILSGLRDTHGKEIIHCDIKPKNILLAADLSGLRRPYGFIAKISGFGKAKRKGSDEYGEGWGQRRGTRRFMSPELIGDMVLDYGADVWAFGCTVLEMLTGKRVWEEEGELDWEDWITLIGDSGAVPHVPDHLSDKAKDFLSKCLERDPARRWTVDRLIRHPFVYDYS